MLCIKQWVLPVYFLLLLQLPIMHEMVAGGQQTMVLYIVFNFGLIGKS